MTAFDKPRIINPAPDPDRRIELRGRSGRLYGILDPHALTIEFKRKADEPAERIDLRPYLEVTQR